MARRLQRGLGSQHTSAEGPGKFTHMDLPRGPASSTWQITLWQLVRVMGVDCVGFQCPAG